MTLKSQCKSTNILGNNFKNYFINWIFIRESENHCKPFIVVVRIIRFLFKQGDIDQDDTEHHQYCDSMGPPKDEYTITMCNSVTPWYISKEISLVFYTQANKNNWNQNVVKVGVSNHATPWNILEKKLNFLRISLTTKKDSVIDSIFCFMYIYIMLC